MPYAPVTIPAFAVQGILSGARSRWESQPNLIKEIVVRAGMSWDLLDEPGARVTAEQYVRLYTLLIAALDDEAIALLSRPLRPGSFALMVRSMRGAKTIEAAVDRAAHTLTILQDDLIFSCVREGALTGITSELRRPDTVLPTFAHELLMRVCWRLIVWMLDSGSRPKSFDFSFDRPAYADAYEAIFPGQLLFGQSRSAAWFDSADLAGPLQRSDRDAQTFLKSAPANVIVPGLVRTGAGARVRALLEHAMPGWPGLPDIAHDMGMSIATLQRRLARERTSFRAVKEELRRDLAITRLNTSRVPVAILAGELGFADSATFQRAFKIWTGNSPGRYRQREQRPATANV
ncbi:AraC family transcriptional regulator [Sphingomonas sp.]|uniref:AraC family transcriptional regulator n=1 Tax=Sphingomonas sp. TaxID=28214 RepID=UPI003D6C8124